MRQPAPGGVLMQAELYGAGAGQAQTEQMLGIAGHAGRIAMPPGRVDVVHIRQLPVAQLRG